MTVPAMSVAFFLGNRIIADAQISGRPLKISRQAAILEQMSAEKELRCVQHLSMVRGTSETIIIDADDVDGDGKKWTNLDHIVDGRDGNPLPMILLMSSLFADDDEYLRELLEVAGHSAHLIEKIKE